MKPKFLLTKLILGGSPLYFGIIAQGSSLYWDTDGNVAGAGGASPNGAWTTGGSTWSADQNGTAATPGLTTTLANDLFISAGVDATGAYGITLNDAQAAKSLTFQDGTATLSGTGGVINLGGTGMIRVNNSQSGAPLAATIGANTTTVIGGTVGLTKTGNGTLNLNGSQAHTFSGGINVTGGILNLHFANLSTPTNLIDSANALTIGGGGRLLITGNPTGTTGQTFGNVTVASGGGQLLGNRNGGDALNITQGTLTTTAKGGSLLTGATVGGTSPIITTTSDKDATGIYSGRVVFSNGTAGTGYDWATSSGAGPHTLGAYAGYTAMAVSGADSNNSRIIASHTLTGNLTTNSLKFESTGNAQILNLGASTLTLASGGLLVTGITTPTNQAGPRIQNGTLTAGAGSNYDLVIHQYHPNDHVAGNIDRNVNINAIIADNGVNAVTLVKAGTGTLVLSSANTFTGGIVVNDGGTLVFRTVNTILNHNSITFNANTIVKSGVSNVSTNGGITINNGSQIDFRNNTQTFTANGAVTGEGGGITLGQEGGGATRLNFNSTSNNFTGPIRYAVTSQDGTLTVGSLADTTTLSEGNITFGLAGGATIPHVFNYGATAVAPLTLNNRRFELAGTTQGAPRINNNSTQAVHLNADLISSGTGTKTLTLGGSGVGLSTFAGDITNGSITTLNLTKADSGTWVLSGDNSYNGATTVSAGKLLINGNQSAASGAVAVNGTSTLGGSGQIGGNVTLAANTTLAPGSSIESLATGALTFLANATFAYEINNDALAAAAGDLAAVTGGLNLDLTNLTKLTFTELGAGSWAIGEKLTLISYSGIWNGGLFNYNSGTLADDSTFEFDGAEWLINYNDTTPGTNFSADLTGPSFVTMTVMIPEPGTALLGSLGLLALLRRCRN